MKDKLIKAIREVPIADKTYPEYVEALADKLIDEDYRKISDDHQRQCTCYALGCQMAEDLKKEVAREIFEEIGELINEYLDGRIYTHDFCTILSELKKKYTEDGK